MKKIIEFIKSKETMNFRFKPDREFYEAVNINRKRWGLLFRGKVDPTITELKALGNFFNIAVNELI